MPSVSDPCRENQDFVNLREANVLSVDEFITWWRMNFSEKEFDCQEQRAIQKRISIFVG